MLTVATVNDVDNKFFALTLGHKVADILASLPHRVGSTENFPLTKHLKLSEYREPQTRGFSTMQPLTTASGNLVDSHNVTDELRQQKLQP